MEKEYPAGRSVRLVKQCGAAEYCGVSVAVFKRSCPVKPINLGHQTPILRWDLVDLDFWINALKMGSHEGSASVHWLDRVGQ